MEPVSLTLLLAFEAAGIITSWFGNREQRELSRMGTELDKAAVASSIAASRLQTETASLTGMQNLRQTLGSQAAVLAARGTRSGIGGALALEQKSERAWGEDEKTLRINQMIKENRLKAQNIMLDLHQQGYESQLGQAMGKQIFQFGVDAVTGVSQMKKGSTTTASPSAPSGMSYRQPAQSSRMWQFTPVGG